MVPFDSNANMDAGGSVKATFPMGCCVQLYGPAAGIPPVVIVFLQL
jgi:hypothetical protein